MISYEEAKQISDRMFQRKATIQDYIVYLRFEMQEAMKVLPPDAKDNQSDGWHASACALRAYASTFQLERLLGLEQHVVGTREAETTEPRLVTCYYNSNPHTIDTHGPRFPCRNFTPVGAGAASPDTGKGEGKWRTKT